MGLKKSNEEELKEKKNFNYFLAIIFFIQIFFLFFLVTENMSLRRERFYLNEKIKFIDFNLNDSINFLSEEETQFNDTVESMLFLKNLLFNLKQEKLMTQYFLENKEKNYELLNESFFNLQNNFYELYFNISNLENQVNSSLLWVFDNSKINRNHLSNFNLSSFILTSLDKCVLNEEINLACVNFLMEKELDFSYKINYEQKLNSIKEILENKGGDCEDYSIFFLAYLNYLKENEPNLKLKMWEYEKDSFFKFYETEAGSWFKNDAKEKIIGNLKNYQIYMICYLENYETKTGHCLLSFSSVKLNSIDDLFLLNNSLLFEPQTAEFVGLIGQEIKLNKNNQLNQGDILLILTKNDLYIYENEWVSYQTFLEKINFFKKNFASTGI